MACRIGAVVFVQFLYFKFDCLGMAVVIDAPTTQLLRSTGEYFWGGAASTAFWIDPEEDMFVVFMTQLLPSSFYPIRSELRVAAYQALID